MSWPELFGQLTWIVIGFALASFVGAIVKVKITLWLERRGK